MREAERQDLKKWSEQASTFALINFHRMQQRMPMFVFIA
jgi:hypothetical protein